MASLRHTRIIKTMLSVILSIACQQFMGISSKAERPCVATSRSANSRIIRACGRTHGLRLLEMRVQKGT